jgi:hypothetical protein
LARAECVHSPWAAGINVGGHYNWHFFLFLSSSSGSSLILPERTVVGFEILPGLLTNKKY